MGTQIVIVSKNAKTLDNKGDKQGVLEQLDIGENLILLAIKCTHLAQGLEFNGIEKAVLQDNLEKANKALMSVREARRRITQIPK